MVRTARRAVPLACVLGFLLTGQAIAGTAATVDVTIESFEFRPSTPTVALGSTLRWTNRDSDPHTSTSYGKGALQNNPDGTRGIGLWQSPVLQLNQTYSLAFRGAGSFPYYCELHTFMTGSVKVSPTANPGSGGVGTVFTITFAQVNPGPRGFAFDVQKKDPGGSFEIYRSGVETKSVTFTPTQPGTYQFRVRAERKATGGISYYSPVVSIVVDP